jgi:hypothetical protein
LFLAIPHRLVLTNIQLAGNSLSTTTGTTSNGILLLWIGPETAEEQLEDPG